MRTHLAPVILKLNELICDSQTSLDPPNEHEIEAIRLMCFAKDMLTRARAELERADIERERT